MQHVTNESAISKATLVSTVAQDPLQGTIENMTILENIALAYKRGKTRALQLFSNKDRISFFKDNLKRANIGLEKNLDKLITNLSGGQRQILSIIMTLLQDFKILLLDEINAALDPKSSECIIELANDIINTQKITCLMITHNMSHAIKYGDRLLILKRGRFIKEYD